MGAHPLIHRLARLLALALIVLVASTTSVSAAPGGNPGGGNPNEECPAGTFLVAKFNFNGSGYDFEKPAGNEGVVTITNGSATGGSWSSTVPIGAVIVKGGTDTDVDLYDPAVTSGTFSNAELLNNGGQTPAISNIQFCGSDDPPPPPDCCLQAYEIVLNEMGGEIKAKVSVKFTDGYIPDNADVTVRWDLPNGTSVTQTVNTMGDDVAEFSIGKVGDGTYKLTVTNANGFDGTPFCGEASAEIEVKSDCCLEANIISTSISGNSIIAQVAVQYSDGYIPNNVDVTVVWTTPDGPVTQTANTQADGGVDNIATFSIPITGPGLYSVVVTNADGFDGTPFCNPIVEQTAL